MPPKTASVIAAAAPRVEQGRRRASSSTGASSQPLSEPVSIYEVHLGSWRLNSLEDNRSLTYAELADELSAYATDMGFTHVELLPVMAHPFSGSWGYQVTGYFAPTPRYGSPDDLRQFVDRLHARGIGVILDWVPAHFPRDEFALARFDGTALYEHADPRRGAHPDWGTLVFNFGRHEVRNFLISNALFWLREYHVDGIRVDAVASMLYLDYSRRAGEWIPNQFGGREDLDAVAFLKELNEVIYAHEPGIISAAEESTAWPGVSRPTYLGGLGFGFKWNMGWMHDTLAYFQQDPIYRRYHHHELTFSLMYAFSENFVLPLSHDEVVHGKGSLYTKMAGADHWQKLANLRALYAYMWAHPGKKLLFMGGELAQEAEWSHERSLDWHLLERPEHAGIQSLVRDLNRALPRRAGAVGAGLRPGRLLVAGAQRRRQQRARLRPRSRRTASGWWCSWPTCRRCRATGYRLGLPRSGRWREAINTDSSFYGGSDVGNLGGVAAGADPVARPAVLGGADAASAGGASGSCRMSDARAAPGGADYPWERPLGARARSTASTPSSGSGRRARRDVALSLAGRERRARRRRLRDLRGGRRRPEPGDDYGFVRRRPAAAGSLLALAAAGLRGPSRIDAARLTAPASFDAARRRRARDLRAAHRDVQRRGHLRRRDRAPGRARRSSGVTAIEIMPVAEFPGARGWGYDGVYISAAQSSYGGPGGTRRAWSQAAHGAGLAVILDVVYNHLGASGVDGDGGVRAVLHRQVRDPVGQGDQLRRRRLRPGPRVGLPERRGLGARLRHRRAAARRDPRHLRLQPRAHRRRRRAPGARGQPAAPT